MKKIILAVAVVASILVVSCQGNGKDAKTAKDAKDSGKKTEAAVDPSYAFGIAIGNSIKETGVTIKYDSFLKGVKDVLENKKAAITNEEAQKQIQEAIMTATAKKAEDNIAKEKAFFEKNGKEKGVVTTASGLQYQIITEGTGATPKATDTVRVDYVGTLLDGTKFDSSIDRGQPAEFPLNQVIPGWTEAIQLMKVGGKSKFFIPSKLAYGPNGAGGKIAPNSTLVFEVTLLEIVAPASK
jgi:FKBP-type peptidyl-prolyl cis-trans isomerase